MAAQADADELARLRQAQAKADATNTKLLTLLKEYKSRFHAALEHV